MWFIDDTEEPYLLKCRCIQLKVCFPWDFLQGAAWLSSARAVRVGLSPITSATLSLVAGVKPGTLAKLRCKPRGRWGWRHSARPLCPGLHTCTMAGTEGKLCCEAMRISKAGISSVGAATRLREAGFASNRASAMARELRSRACTHRPSSHGSWGYLNP